MFYSEHIHALHFFRKQMMLQAKLRLYPITFKKQHFGSIIGQMCQIAPKIMLTNRLPKKSLLFRKLIICQLSVYEIMCKYSKQCGTFGRSNQFFFKKFCRLSGSWQIRNKVNLQKHLSLPLSQSTASCDCQGNPSGFLPDYFQTCKFRNIKMKYKMLRCIFLLSTFV